MGEEPGKIGPEAGIGEEKKAENCQGKTDGPSARFDKKGHGDHGDRKVGENCLKVRLKQPVIG